MDRSNTSGMPIDREAVIAQVLRTFLENPYPGDGLLQGSFEGCEPFDEVGPFQGKVDWREIDPAFLDAHGTALSFFSEAGFRFFLPAFLIADLREQLQYADPLFHVTHGFFDFSVTLEQAQRTFVITSGKTRFINPRRYGAMTAFDYARYRLSVFTREEAAAIVAYLQYKRATGEGQFATEFIDAALDQFWLERTQSAPTATSLQQYMAADTAYYEAMRAEHGAGESTCQCP